MSSNNPTQEARDLAVVFLPHICGSAHWQGNCSIGGHATLSSLDILKAIAKVSPSRQHLF